MPETDDDERATLHRLAALAPDIERMVDADKKARWLWALARSIALWVTTVTVGIAAFKTFIIDLLGGKH